MMDHKARLAELSDRMERICPLLEIKCNCHFCKSAKYLRLTIKLLELLKHMQMVSGPNERDLPAAMIMCEMIQESLDSMEPNDGT